MSERKLMPLTRSQVEVLKTTFRTTDTEVFVSTFYQNLFKEYPNLRPLFPTDLSDLTSKLISVFELTIYSFVEKGSNTYYLQDEVLVPLRELGKRHTERGVVDANYPMVNKLLIKTLKEQVGYVFPAEAETAWALALDHLTHAMLNDKVKVSEKSTRLTMRDSFNYIKEILSR
jgi:hemoglobin-like flavoprotein